MRQRSIWTWWVLGLLTAVTMLLLHTSGSIAQEENEKPLLEPWQHQGIMAAMTDPDPWVWGEALNKLAEFDLEALTSATEIPKYVYQQITEILDNGDYPSDTRAAAARALGSMSEAAPAQAPQLMTLLADPDTDPSLRFDVASALGGMGEAAAAQAPQLMTLLADPDTDHNLRFSAAIALRGIGEAAPAQAPQLMTLLADPDTDPSLRFDVASALGGMGEAAAAQAPQLMTLLADPDTERNLRFSAASALRGIGEAAAAQAPQLGTLMTDTAEQDSLRYAAAVALSHMGNAIAGEAVKFKPLLAEHSGQRFRREELSVVAAKALSQVGSSDLGPLKASTIIHLLNAASFNKSTAALFRFTAYYLSDGDVNALTLIRWLGLRDEGYLPDATQLPYKEAQGTLWVFADAWPQDIANLTELDDEWPQQIADIVRSTIWSPGDLPLLRQHYQNLRDINSTQAAAVASEIATLEWWRGIWIGRNIWIAHALFWLALVFIYPLSPQVQAIFFWNPWIRRIFGAGYVGFALTWIPFLRARLFAPFQDSLLANAGLAGFTPATYFPDSTTSNQATGEQQPLQTAIPAIKGQVILEGESGLGKTMFLRHLIQRTLQRRKGRSRFEVIKYLTHPPRTMVFLPADRCANGVSEAIQAKLHGMAKDPNFLRDLVYSGAIDICIDGLNEVTADTRAKITEFVERYFKGNIIMTTQPLEWRPPATATTYKLNPLKRDKIQAFLVSREPTLPDDAPIRGKDYVAACATALEAALDPEQPSEELTAARRILSNPMDLSLVAQMIANKESPNLFQLQQQQYKLMAADYQQLHLRAFPLAAFSQQVYDMRLHDQTAIPETNFFEELQCMERHKMVTRRQGTDNEGHPTKEWNFRHDKVMEFFIVQTFLGKENDRPQQHMSDPRFRGVYFLLAKLMPMKDALTLREELINYAADTRDHTVSDDFVQLLRSRSVRETA